MSELSVNLNKTTSDFLSDKVIRQRAMLSKIKEQHIISVKTLVKEFAVSIETVRRDLSELQAQGCILRQHGKAQYFVQEDDIGKSLQQRKKSHSLDKEQLTQHVLSYLVPMMVIAIDASSTCLFLAKKLPDIPITVLTNSALLLEELKHRSNITLISTGGWYDAKYGAYTNPSLLALLKHITLDLFIFSCEGIDPKGMLWDSNPENSRFKAILLKKSEQSMLLVDKSKKRRRGSCKIGSIDEVSFIISNDEFMLKESSC